MCFALQSFHLVCSSCLSSLRRSHWRCCAHNPLCEQTKEGKPKEFHQCAIRLFSSLFSINSPILKERVDGREREEWRGAGIKVSVQQQQLTPFQRCFHFVNFMLYSPQLLYPCTVIILFYSTQWNQSNLISLNQIKKKFNFFCFVRWNGVKIDLFAASSIKN